MLVDDRPIAAFYVDVNSAAENGEVGTTRRSAVAGYGHADEVTVGSYVWAVDADDNACEALVTGIEGEWLLLHMNEETWQSVASITDGLPNVRNAQVSLYGLDPRDVLKAMLQTPKPER